jgi:hypothetical protein
VRPRSSTIFLASATLFTCSGFKGMTFFPRLSS